MTEEDKKTTSEFMHDFWDFFKKYLNPPEDDDEFWDEALKEADNLMQKYDHNPVFDETIAGYVAGIDMKWRKATGRWRE